MDLIVLGGTGFVGRHLVASAMRRGHNITLFSRGQTGPFLFPQVRTIVGDRDGSLDSLQTGFWDAAIDTHARKPRMARRAAEALANRVGHYTFISSISAYQALQSDAPPSGEVVDENSPSA